jgi:putative ABC transport system permease protein
MVGNYLKTAGRNLLRNKLFSVINILGLAISISVGLLLIAFLSDLLSYDTFHRKAHTIYRLITTIQHPNGPSMELASTSVKAAYKIRETIPGIQQATVLRRGFSGDAVTGEYTIPLSALWADENFLDVFTFPLLQGNPATALQEPYSLVLTEKTAKKLFRNKSAMGKWIRFDTLNYQVTGILKDIPKLSHLQFEALVSFSSVAIQKPDTDGGFLSWESVYMNYAYLTLPPSTDLQTVQATLDTLSTAENAFLENIKITLSLQPLPEIVLGKNLANPVGASMPVGIIWIMGGLAGIVILSACFNYTNLSIARSMRRSREVGVRKIVGAYKWHIMSQFMMESLLTSLIALVFSFPLFMVLRKHFLLLHPHLQDLATLHLSAQIILSFIVLAAVVGMVAGFLPALFFSRIRAIQVLKPASSLPLFRRVTLRKAFIVVQFFFSMLFISATLIGYTQYRHLLSLDLGFSTENLITIPLQGNKIHLLEKEFAGLPEVKGISKSLLLNGLGSFSGVSMQYNNPQDSAMVFYNSIDENYIPLHAHALLAGKNFVANPAIHETEVIVNEQVLERFNIAGKDPAKAIGETVLIGKTRMTIVGVVKDFHHASALSKKEPFVFRYAPKMANYLQLKISSSDWPSTLARIDEAWRKVDPIHPLQASFFSDQVEKSYTFFFAILKISGFLAFLSISVASIGLFGC